jgi:serine protease inhibitor ecotin
LNLQYGGRAVAYYTNTWDLELRQQVLERIGPTRQFQAGFKRAVLMYDITMKATVDEDILDVLFGRATEQDALMHAHRRAMS